MREYTPKALVTREKILRAANDLFYLNGYNATGVDRIIADAEVTKGNFFHHFKNKEELATSVLEWHRDLTLAEIDVTGLLAAPSPGRALLELARRVTRRIAADTDACQIRGCFFGNFALEMSVGSEPVRKKVKEIFDGMRDLIRELIEKAQAKGEIRKDLDARSTAAMMLALLEGAALLDKTNQTDDESRQALAFITRYLAL